MTSLAPALRASSVLSRSGSTGRGGCADLSAQRRWARGRSRRDDGGRPRRPRARADVARSAQPAAAVAAPAGRSGPAPPLPLGGRLANALRRSARRELRMLARVVTCDGDVERLRELNEEKTGSVARHQPADGVRRALAPDGDRRLFATFLDTCAELEAAETRSRASPHRGAGGSPPPTRPASPAQPRRTVRTRESSPRGRRRSRSRSGRSPPARRR